MTDQKSIDYGLLMIVFTLICLGIVMVYSSSAAIANNRFENSSYILKQQVLRVIISLVLLFIVMRIDYHVFIKYAKVGLVISVLLLLFLIVSDQVSSIKGAKRWIKIFDVTFQPSEMAKFFLILFLAGSLSKNQTQLQNFTTGFLPHGVILGVICGLVFLQPDMGTGLLIGGIGMLMFYIAGIRFWHIAGIGLLCLPVLYSFILSGGYRKARLLAFFQTDTHTDHLSYQINQSLISLGAGGIFGKGLGESSQKLFFLPEPYTDFVFAIIGEELGFVTAVGVVLLYLIFNWKGIKVSLKAPDTAGFYLAIGITIMISFYALCNICVACNLIPTKGLPLPFISYGGSSLFFSMLGVGLLLNIGAQGVQNKDVRRLQAYRKVVVNYYFSSAQRNKKSSKLR